MIGWGYILCCVSLSHRYHRERMHLAAHRIYLISQRPYIALQEFRREKPGVAVAAAADASWALKNGKDLAQQIWEESQNSWEGSSRGGARTLLSFLSWYFPSESAQGFTASLEPGLRKLRDEGWCFQMSLSGGRSERPPTEPVWDIWREHAQAPGKTACSGDTGQ